MKGKIKRSFIIFFVFILVSIQIQAQTWSSNIRLIWTPDTSWFPTITADSGNGIHVVWQEDIPGNSEIFFKRSTNKGTDWLGKRQLTWTSGGSRNPALAADSGSGIHIVWDDDRPGAREIYYRRSTNSGANWLTNKRLTYTSGDSKYSSIAADSSSGIHVVWQDDTPGNREIYYKRSTDSGANWLAKKRLTWTSGGSRVPRLATASGGGIHITWDDSDKGNYEIYYKRSTDGGATWLANKRLTWTSGGSIFPTIVASSASLIHIAWQDSSPGNTEIYYKRSTDGGATWLANQRLTWDSGSSDRPCLTADSGTGIHVVWDDQNHSNIEVFHKLSTDSGANWGGKKRLTWNSGSSKSPFIATDSSSGIHIVWNDDTPGNAEIYYKNRK